MYHHTVSGLSTVKSTFDYGCGFQEHVKDYWKAKCIKTIYLPMNDKFSAIHVDFKEYIGYGDVRVEAIEDLLMALDDRIR